MFTSNSDLLPALERQENKSRGLPVRNFANEEDIRRFVNFHENDNDRILLFSHCSSIVKPSPDFSELFACNFFV